MIQFANNNNFDVAFEGLKFYFKLFIDDGDYDIYYNGDGTYTLSISKAESYSMIGVLNRRLFFSTEDVFITDLRKGKKYYFYICYQDSMNLNPMSFRKVLSTTIKAESNYCLLMAIIDLTGEKPIIIEDPDDKIYTKNIIAHANDFSNPHGRKLYQDKLFVNDALYVNGHQIFETVYKEIVLNGVDGLEIEFEDNKVVKFVSSCSTSVNTGNIWFNIDGNKLIVFNNGDAVPCILEIKLQDVIE